MNIFYIDKTQNTMADSLKAFGFMHIVAQLFAQQFEEDDTRLTIIDKGAYFQIEASNALDLEKIAQAQLFMPAKFLQTAKNTASLPTDNPLFVERYEYERDRRKQFFDVHFNGLDKTAKRAYAIGDAHPALANVMQYQPHRDWELFRLLNPAGIIGYNSLLAQWYLTHEKGVFGDICLLLIELFRQPHQDIAAAEKQWKALAKPHKWGTDATASQILNPSQGKGINKALPNGAGLANVKNFWLIEFLKAVGLFEIGISRVLRNSKDRKTYVPAFGRMSRKMSKRIDTRFRSKMRFSETAVRSDILMVINYLQTFLDYIETPPADAPDPFDGFDDDIQTPAAHMRGFHVAFYKDLGNAAATMNISFLNLPSWITATTEAEVALFQDVLGEHKKIIEQFDEGISDELSLLQAYRNFISADHLDPFFEFTTLFSSYLIRKGEAGGYAPKRLTVNNLRRLIVSNDPELSPILESEGFRNIATAIRRSTILAQYRRKAFDDRRYTVRYGLGRDLMRQAQYRSDFLIALSEFMQSYNQENAQVMENRDGPYRPSITTDDITAVVGLIDAYDSAELIAKMLVAFGYAREPRREQPVSEQEENTNE